MEVHGQSDEQASANMAEFALRSLATMVNANPAITLRGKVPNLGSRLNIKKRFCYSLLIVNVAGHLILLVTAIMTRSVIKMDNSYVETTKFLSGKRDFTLREDPAQLSRKHGADNEMTNIGLDG